jgi:hypothetical protein
MSWKLTIKRNWLRSILLVGGWVISAAAILYSAIGLEVHWNLFSWYGPHESHRGIVPLVLAAAAVGTVFFLSKAPAARVTRILTLIPGLPLLWFALQALPAEPLSTGWLGRSNSSPLWFRICITGLLTAPALFALAGLMLNWRKSGGVNRPASNETGETASPGKPPVPPDATLALAAGLSKLNL